MRAWAFSALPALLLAGCGEGDDFTVEVKRPIGAVYAPLAAADVGEARRVFPGMTVARTRPSDGEILYTIPGSYGSDATVRLRLEPVRGGEATVIHAAVHTPLVHARIDGSDKVLSEFQVELALKALLRNAARNLEMGSSGGGDTARLTAFLLAVAIATNKSYLDQALAFRRDPEKLAGLMTAFRDADAADPVTENRAAPMVDPDRRESDEHLAAAREDWQRERELEKAAEPSTDLDRGFGN
jgi:hypothetical protein